MSGYPYQDHTNSSRVALEVRARGRSSYELRNSNHTAHSNNADDDYMRLSADADRAAYFRWKRTLDRPVGAAVLATGFAPFSGYSDATAGSSDYRAFLSFNVPQPAVIEWDPVTGVSTPSTGGSGSAAAALHVCFAVVTMMATAVLALLVI